MNNNNNNNCYFCLNGIDHNNNHNNNNELLALKGASAIISPQPPATANTTTTIAISSTEADLIRNVINIAGFYVTRNPQVFQQPEEIIRKLTKAFNILATKEIDNNSNNNSVKGASSICPTKKKHFEELLNMFHL